MGVVKMHPVEAINSSVWLLFRMSNTPGNPGNLLEF
jgi:hypothetical protein